MEVEGGEEVVDVLARDERWLVQELSLVNVRRIEVG